MSEAPTAVGPVSAPSAQPAHPTAVTNKIFVSGLGLGDTEEQVRQLFSSYGDVLGVMVDGSCATVTFQEERVVQEIEQVRDITLRGRNLTIARVLEEHLDSPDNNHSAPFYQSGPMPAPAPQFPAPAPQYPAPDTGLSSSYPSYHPVWYQQPPPHSPYYDQAVADCGPVQSQHLYQPPSSSYYSVPPPSKTSAVDRSVFSFDTTATQLDQQQYLASPSPSTGCCHVCSTPAVQGVAPLTVHQLPGHPPYYGHQLQPLTPMTPSLHTGYLLPPTPTPTNLPPMTPTYYLPPTPAPSYMMYQHQPHTTHARPADEAGLPYTSKHLPPTYTNLKPSDTGTVQEDGNTHRQNVAYFTSPFKRFTKFRGTPTPARFPLRSGPVQQGNKGRGGGGDGDSSSWYQQGDRWGQRRGGKGSEGTAPDLLRDCKGVKETDKNSME